MGASGFDAPLVVDNRVFVGSNQTVVSYNPAIGARLYEEPIYHTKGVLRLVFSSDLVIAVNLLGNAIPDGAEVGLTGFEAQNGHGRFSVALDPLINFRPNEGLEVELGNVSVVTKNATGSCVFTINSLGMIQWNRQIDGTTTASPALAYNRVYVPTATKVYALNLKDGSVNWSIPLSGNGSASSPAVAGGKLFFGLDDSYVYALDAYSGDTLWTYKTEGPVRSSPAISDGVLFVGSEDGNLYAIGQPVEQIPEFSPLLICFVALVTTLVVFIACRKSEAKLANTNLRKVRK